MTTDALTSDPTAGMPGGWLAREEVARALNPHLLNLLSLQPCHPVRRLQAVELLTPARLDIVAKYIYAVQRNRNGQAAWGPHVYREHLRVWNDFVEGDLSGKTAFEGYLHSFHQVLDSFRESGFDPRLGLIPVGSDNVIIDGAHRVAAALCFDKAMEAVQFDTRPARYDYHYFRERGLEASVLDDMALQYCTLDQRVRAAVLFPVAAGRDRQVITLLEELGSLVCEKSLSFTQTGKSNLIRLLYRDEPWLGDGIRPTPGLLHHVNSRFQDSKPVKFVFFLGGNAEAARSTKERIRSLFNIGNDSIHIADTHRQTLAIAQSILNANSVDFLNHRRTVAFKHFDRLFTPYQDWLDRPGMEPWRFCVDASAVLAAYGLRDANDLDFLYFGESAPQAPEELISCHNSQITHYGASVDDLVLDPRNYFYHRGRKFLALHLVRDMKIRRAEAKDTGDVYRIDAMRGDEGPWGTILNYYYTLPERVYSFRFRTLRTVKQLIPKPLLPIARAVYRLPRTVKVWVGPAERRTIYRGFELHYSRGTTIAERIVDGSVYEPEVAETLRTHLSKTGSPTFLDIGANIGLMALNVLADLPAARVFAFEPGPHQARFLQRNIDANNLHGRVTLIPGALGDKIGQAGFAVHRSWHSSGDGFFDTHRAGRTQVIQVRVTTLDAWWRSEGTPDVHAMKIDTEGAELWVLNGGEALITACRPLIIFELHPKNIRVYPHEPIDVLTFFWRHGYTVRSLTGVTLAKETLEKLMASNNDYVAVPDHV